MTTTTLTTIDTLNELIQVCRDGAQGFHAAAEAVGDSKLERMLYDLSGQRTRFVGELRQCVLRQNGEPFGSGSLGGAVHRVWMSLRDAISTRNAITILEDCERGEELALSAYRDGLATLVEPDVVQVVRAQAIEVQVSHEQLRTWRYERMCRAS
ncbi:ferritin-like domain-containing protein [Actomonas aquatica]|uniref:PA2169 family four-helix-bundle protein n=1 Tax=Actomonas aquatica TaxID=2866162 RepID=A0ABZ1CFG3_9BACT|nr:PA2169 family four-helix-bundle protein [Opitutus sp. WL0086]WRQ89963.1 PA2169 family four-helix-bundle protein [Opitutus sp. WL0086]